MSDTPPRPGPQRRTVRMVRPDQTAQRTTFWTSFGRHQRPVQLVPSRTVDEGSAGADNLAAAAVRMLDAAYADVQEEP